MTEYSTKVYFLHKGVNPNEMWLRMLPVGLFTFYYFLNNRISF